MIVMGLRGPLLTLAPTKVTLSCFTTRRQACEVLSTALFHARLDGVALDLGGQRCGNAQSQLWHTPHHERIRHRFEPFRPWCAVGRVAAVRSAERERIGMAHASMGDAHQHFTLARASNINFKNLEGLTSSKRDRGT